jgi:hypothetical protein
MGRRETKSHLSADRLLLSARALARPGRLPGNASPDVQPCRTRLMDGGGIRRFAIDSGRVDGLSRIDKDWGKRSVRVGGG